MTPIDTTTNTPGTRITVGSDPGAIAITRDGSTAYVANYNSNNVTPIDTATNTEGLAITAGNQPDRELSERVVISATLAKTPEAKAGKVNLSIACAAGSGSCQITALLREAGVQVADITRRIPAGSTQTITITISGRDGVELAKHLKLTIELTVDGQHDSIASRALTI